ncbi:MAG: GTPase ObgE [Actinomycetaceae bacterium]|nr:GTPase ObgE [Actinomycetaceae bacterium]
MANFIDRVHVHATAGKGGDGCASIHREKFKPLAGPDGGNGGNGGSVILKVDAGETTLATLYHVPHQKAENGTPGAGDWRPGRNGKDKILCVPKGTVVKNEHGEILADLAHDGDTYVVAHGGIGGLGNSALASRQRKAPGFALLGLEGEERDIYLELKSIADVALVGFPSAGKSSLISAVSAARPKIADYPFTTLIPHLGVVQAGDYRYTIADVPGLIPGASEGKGLGLEFLRHIERCSVIVHVIDCATYEPGRDPLSDLDVLLDELREYSASLTYGEGEKPLHERPAIVVLNKIDVREARELAEFVKEDIENKGFKVCEVSTATHEGLNELTYLLGRIIEHVKEKSIRENGVDKQRVDVHVKNAPAVPFTIRKAEKDGEEFYQVRGKKPEMWVRQTNFDNDEAVGYLADRLQKIGIEDALVKIGARSGDMVVIGSEDDGFIFDWEPTVVAHADIQGPRGSDHRLNDSSRLTRKEKRENY